MIDRYDTSGNTEGLSQPGSDDKVLLNQLGIICADEGSFHASLTRDAAERRRVIFCSMAEIGSPVSIAVELAILRVVSFRALSGSIK